MPPRFVGKVALVTGASNRGIGGAIAERLAREGAIVMLLSRTEPDRLLDRIGAAGGSCRWLRCDVTERDEITRVLAHVIEQTGWLDVLVNNAGYEVLGGFAELSDDEWQKLVGINLSGVMRMSHAALPTLVTRKGVIVNVTSASAQGGTPGLVAYSAVKAGVDGLTRSLAAEYASKGIRVVGVAPALVKTPMSARHASSMTEDAWRKLVDCHPLGIGSPHDVASAVAFLASHEARWISGITLPMGWMPSYPLPYEASSGTSG